MANWFEKILPSFIRKGTPKKSTIPEGLWQSCPSCNNILYVPELESNLFVCTKCDHHIRIGARKRLELFLDSAEMIEISGEKAPKDWLKFKDTKPYRERIDSAQKSSNEKEALLAMKGSLKKLPIVASAFEFRYMGGSMGSVVGQKFVDTVNYALENQLPMVCFSTSGGARMQESMISLFQMGKTAAAVKKLKNKKLPFISVLVDPCYGGVTASLAMLGDLILAEPKARIGFSGKRVIQDTVKEDLPKDFQTAETQLENGFVDKIIDRKNFREFVDKILTMLQ